MKIWTASRDWSGKYLPMYNSWKPRYGGFDYRVSKTDTQAAEVVAECEAAVRWLPFIRAGVKKYCREMREEGEVFQDIKISLTKIYEHEVDTTELVMFARHGFSRIHERQDFPRIATRFHRSRNGLTRA